MKKTENENKQRNPFKIKLLALVTALILIAGTFHEVMTTIAEGQEEGTGSAYATIISNDVILFTSHDKMATNEYVPHYTTLGFVVTRCRRGNAESDSEKEALIVPDEYIWFLLEDEDGKELILENAVNNGDGTSNIEWKMSFNIFKERVKEAGFDKWYADLNDEEATEDLHILMDAIMTTKVRFKYTNPNTGITGPMMLQEEALIDEEKNIIVHRNPGGKPYVYSVEKLGDIIPGITPWHKLRTAYGWARPKSIDSHFHQFRTIQNVIPPAPPIEETPEEITSHNFGKRYPALSTGTSVNVAVDDTGSIRNIPLSMGTPTYNTYNTSPDFDLSKGIPTTENITNGINTNTWYGAGELSHKTMNSVDLYKTRVYIYSFSSFVKDFLRLNNKICPYIHSLIISIKISTSKNILLASIWHCIETY